jgi:hypothetical protein
VPILRRVLSGIGALIGAVVLLLLVAAAATPFVWPRLAGRPVVGVVAEKREEIQAGSGRDGSSLVRHRLELRACYRLPDEPPAFSSPFYRGGEEGPEELDTSLLTDLEDWERHCARAPGKGRARVVPIWADGPLYDRLQPGDPIRLLVAPLAGAAELVAHDEGVLPPTGAAGTARATATVTAVRRYEEVHRRAREEDFAIPYEVVSFRFRPAGAGGEVAAYDTVDVDEDGPPREPGAEIVVTYRTDAPRQASIDGATRRYLWFNIVAEIGEWLVTAAVVLGGFLLLARGVRLLWRRLLARAAARDRR